MPPKPTKRTMTAKQLRKLMEEHGVKEQVELARIVGVHPVTVWRWMSGGTVIGLRTELLIREKLKNRKA